MPFQSRRRRSGSSPRSLHSYGERLASDTARFFVLCFFVAAVFAMGGGSRADVLSLVILRPVAFLVGSYALLVARPGELRAVAWPLGLLACLALIIAVQLIPLPPGLWTALPGRELYARIAADAGIPLGYRPLTLSPSRTLNALFSLSVPMSAVLILAVQGERQRASLFTVLLVACAASALLAIAQMAGSAGGPLYFYRITNADFPVGLFANRNHQALLMVVLLALMADYHRRARRFAPMGALPSIGMAFAALVVIALIIVAGSRAGLLLAALALPVLGWVHYRGRNQQAGAKLKLSGRAWVLAILVALIAIVVATVISSRAVSFDRLWANDALDDYRVERLAILWAMLKEHWLFGIGFGAFQGTFKQYETLEVLTPFIFNQAHADWIQFPMEGGALAAALMIGVGLWLVVQAYRATRAVVKGTGGTRFTAAWILVLIALASLVDYPLRTPIFMAIGAMAFTVLSLRATPQKAR
jgi:hypothetical protein